MHFNSHASVYHRRRALMNLNCPGYLTMGVRSSNDGINEEVASEVSSAKSVTSTVSYKTWKKMQRKKRKEKLEKTRSLTGDFDHILVEKTNLDPFTFQRYKKQSIPLGSMRKDQPASTSHRGLKPKQDVKDETAVDETQSKLSTILQSPTEPYYSSSDVDDHTTDDDSDLSIDEDIVHLEDLPTSDQQKITRDWLLTGSLVPADPQIDNKSVNLLQQQKSFAKPLGEINHNRPGFMRFHSSTCGGGLNEFAAMISSDMLGLVNSMADSKEEARNPDTSMDHHRNIVNNTLLEPLESSIIATVKAEIKSPVSLTSFVQFHFKTNLETSTPYKINSVHLDLSNKKENLLAIDQNQDVSLDGKTVSSYHPADFSKRRNADDNQGKSFSTSFVEECLSVSRRKVLSPSTCTEDNFLKQSKGSFKKSFTSFDKVNDLILKDEAILEKKLKIKHNEKEKGKSVVEDDCVFGEDSYISTKEEISVSNKQEINAFPTNTKTSTKTKPSLNSENSKVLREVGCGDISSISLDKKEQGESADLDEQPRDRTTVDSVSDPRKSLAESCIPTKNGSDLTSRQNSSKEDTAGLSSLRTSSAFDGIEIQEIFDTLCEDNSIHNSDDGGVKASCVDHGNSLPGKISVSKVINIKNSEELNFRLCDQDSKVMKKSDNQNQKEQAYTIQENREPKQFVISKENISGATSGQNSSTDRPTPEENSSLCCCRVM